MGSTDFSSASVEFKDGKAHIRTCFTAGTLVHTKEGLKNIENVQIGDVVMSKSDVTGEVSYKKVVNTFIRQTDEIYNVKFENASILETTWNHPFRRLKTDGVASLLLDRGQIGSMDLSEWREARDLKKGDQIYSADGSLLVVESVIIEQREETVYNFEVEDFHTYFVGEDGVWVHNEAGCGQISLSATPKSMENGIKEKYNLAGDELKRVSEESAQAYNAANTIASKRALGLISEAEASKQLATIAKGKHPSILDAIEQGRSSGMLLGTVGLGSLAVPGIGIGVLAMPTISGAGTALGMKYATAGMTMSAYMAANLPKLSRFLNLAPSIGSQSSTKVQQELQVVNYQFGKDPNQIYHTFRHIEEKGLSRFDVASSVISHLNNIGKNIPEGENRRYILNVGGKAIEYTAFRLKDGIINIGRITILE